MREGFHAFGGWSFRRDLGGYVAIEVAESDHVDAPLRVAAVFDPDTWASIVASVSHRGDSAETWRAVRLFHQPADNRAARNLAVVLGEVVQYRGKQGHQALRAAIVAATVDTLDPRGVESGEVPALDSPEHVHLVVFTPGERGWFPEFNVPQAEPGMCPPGTWQWPTR
jgi:hypothetical protein